LFLIGVFYLFDFALIGRVTVSEVLVAISLPFLFLQFSSYYFKRASLQIILLLLGIALVTAIVDIYHQNFWEFSARAVARPFFVLIFFLFFYGLALCDFERIKYIVYGFLLAGVINIFRPSQFEAEAAGDFTTYQGIVFRLSPIIGFSALALSVLLKKKFPILIPLIFFSGGVTVLLIGGARSSALVFFLTSLILFLSFIYHFGQRGRIFLSPKRIIGLSVLVLMGLSSLYFLYLWAAPEGILGEEARSKYEMQSENAFGNSPLGLVLSGRTAVYGAILGIMDRPITGFGSWRHDLTSSYTAEAIYHVSNDPNVLRLVSSGADVGGAGHSVLFQTWVENGIFPAIGYLVIAVIAFRVFLRNLRYDSILTPVLVFFFIGFAWNFLFSPPGVGIRFQMGLFLAYFAVFQSKYGVFSNRNRDPYRGTSDSINVPLNQYR
jgi:hypothetical protein